MDDSLNMNPDHTFVKLKYNIRILTDYRNCVEISYDGKLPEGFLGSISHLMWMQSGDVSNVVSLNRVIRGKVIPRLTENATTEEVMDRFMHRLAEYEERRHHVS